MFANKYGLNRGSSGIIINSIKSITDNPLRNIYMPDRSIADVRKEGINISNYKIIFRPHDSIRKYTLCIVFVHWRNRKFSIRKKDSISGNGLLVLYYNPVDNKVNLVFNNITRRITLPSSFSGKKIVLWLAEDSGTNVTNASISNYSATLTIPTVNSAIKQNFEFTTQDGVLSKIMYSPNFYDFDSEQFHKVMLQEKLNGSYVD